jgi:hypothetical protein
MTLAASGGIVPWAVGGACMKRKSPGFSKGWLAAALVSFAGLSAPALAGEPAASPCSTWRTAENSHFRLRWIGVSLDPAAVLRALEVRCEELCERWLGRGGAPKWSPKCEIVVHETGEAFRRRTGRPPSMLAFSDLEIGDGRVWMRRIQARADAPHPLGELLEHELVHVVLAERFSTRRIPRWADEGIAVAEERSGRMGRLERTLLDAVEAGRHIPLSRVLTADRYPADAARADLFYAQSASLVKFLLRYGDAADLVGFADRAGLVGVEAAMRERYPFSSPADAERAWLSWMRMEVEKASGPTAFTTLDANVATDGKES